MKSEKVIVWAFNPYESSPAINKHMTAFLAQLSQEIELNIQPVYVMSSDFYSAESYFEALDIDLLTKKVANDCKKFLDGLEIKKLKEALVLDNHSISRNGEVNPLVKYIVKTSPDFVLLSSSGRKGWARAFLGSFAESFILKSPVPVFVVGPNYKVKSKLKNALMPVELSENSQLFVEKFLDHHALSFLEKLVLFHKVSLIDIENIAWTQSIYGLEKFEAKDIVDRAYLNTKKYLELFLNHPLSEKRIAYDISQSINDLAHVINERVASLDIDLIVMRSESGVLSANIIGSITREVMRDANVPVLIYPHQCEKI